MDLLRMVTEYWNLHNSPLESTLLLYRLTSPNVVAMVDRSSDAPVNVWPFTDQNRLALPFDQHHWRGTAN